MGKLLIITVIVFIGLIVIVGGIFFYSLQISIPNKIVSLDEEMTSQWADVESVYQRRMDLIPNLVNTVKGFADHESEVLVGVTEARSRVANITIDPSKIDAAAMKNFSAMQSNLSSALSRLLVTVEKYPDIKANQNFLELQAQLEGTENRIAVERMRFNETVKDYNIYIRSFPASIVADKQGLEPKTPFEADKGAEKAPKVEF